MKVSSHVIGKWLKIKSCAERRGEGGFKHSLRMCFKDEMRPGLKLYNSTTPFKKKCNLKSQRWTLSEGTNKLPPPPPPNRIPSYVRRMRRGWKPGERLVAAAAVVSSAVKGALWESVCLSSGLSVTDDRDHLPVYSTSVATYSRFLKFMARCTDTDVLTVILLRLQMLTLPRLFLLGGG